MKADTRASARAAPADSARRWTRRRSRPEPPRRVRGALPASRSSSCWPRCGPRRRRDAGERRERAQRRGARRRPSPADLRARGRTPTATCSTACAACSAPRSTSRRRVPREPPRAPVVERYPGRQVVGYADLIAPRRPRVPDAEVRTRDPRERAAVPALRDPPAPAAGRAHRADHLPRAGGRQRARPSAWTSSASRRAARRSSARSAPAPGGDRARPPRPGPAAQPGFLVDARRRRPDARAADRRRLRGVPDRRWSTASCRARTAAPRLELYDLGAAGGRDAGLRDAWRRTTTSRGRDALAAAAPHGSQHDRVRRHGPPLGALYAPDRSLAAADQALLDLAAARRSAALLAALAAWLLGAVAPHGAARGRARRADDREPAREPDRARALERRARALRLRRLARPARAAAHDHRLPRPARRAATATGSTTRGASSSTSPSPGPSGWTR